MTHRAALRRRARPARRQVGRGHRRRRHRHRLRRRAALRSRRAPRRRRSATPTSAGWPRPRERARRRARRRGRWSRAVRRHRRGAGAGAVRRRGRRARPASTCWSTTPASAAPPTSLEMTDEQWHAVLDVTLTGTFRCTRAALRHMIAAGHAGVDRQQRLGARLARPGGPGALRRGQGRRDGADPLRRARGRAARHPGQRGRAEPGMHPFLAKVTTDELLAELTAARGVRPRRRAVGGRQRDRLPGQRLPVVHDRRGRLRQQPAPLTGQRQCAR